MRKVDFNKYSKALLETGKESGMLDQLIADLETVCEKINENIELKKLLASLQVTFTEKKEILKAIFQDFISEKTYNFIFVLIKNNKLQYLNSILKSIQTQSLTSENIFEVIAETVIPLTAGQSEKLQTVLFNKINKKVVIKNLINETLIGGMRIRINDQVIDSTISGKIIRLREKINKL